MIARRALALGAALVLGLSACPSPGDPSPERPSPVSRRFGGTLTVAYPWEPASFDPYSTAGALLPTQDIVTLLAPTLFRAVDSELLPEVAAEVPTMSAAITVDLREGAAWSDGRPIVARDVVESFRRARAARFRPSALEAIASVRADGPRRVTIIFADGAVGSDRQAAVTDALRIFPAHVPRASYRTGFPVGAGPWLLERVRAGRDLRLVPNLAWHRISVLDRLQIVFVPSSDGALALFGRGDVDVLGPYSTPDFHRRTSEVGGFVARRPMGDVRIVFPQEGPGADPDVRAAMRSAVDLDRIVRGLVQDEGEAISAHRYDPDGARTRLTDAGWTGEPVRARDGTDLSFPLMLLASDDIAAFVANAIKFQLGAVGVRLEIVLLDPHELAEEMTDLGDGAVMLGSRLEAPGWSLYRPHVSIVGPTLENVWVPGEHGPFTAADMWQVP